MATYLLLLEALMGEPAAIVGPRLLSSRELFARYGSGRSLPAFRLWLWRSARTGKFPAPLMLGEKLRAWRAADVQAWEESLPSAMGTRADG